MDYVTILAQAAETAGSEGTGAGIVPIDLFWKQITSLGWLEALTFISFGVVCLFYGWRVFKVLVVINFGLLGLLLGMSITQRIVGLNNELAGGLYACGLTETYIWAGALIGVVAGGMISFIVFKAAVILFSSMWGSSLIVVGSLALLYLYPKTTVQVESWVFTLRWFLPTVLMVPTAVGVIVQHKFVKGAKDWHL